MPKFLLGKIFIKTFEVYADDVAQAEQYVLKWQESEEESPEGGIKATKYKLGWTEDHSQDPTPNRNLLLQAFLNLMGKIPGLPSETEPSNLIIHPFEKPKK